MTTQQWPDRLWIVRHGESAGNVARDAAYASGLAVIDVAERDVDVPLSALGERQSRALGDWFGALAEGERPTALLTSTYLRARQTAESIREAGGVEHDAPTVSLYLGVGHDRGRKQRLRVRMLGIAEEICARSQLHDLTEVHHCHAVAKVLDRCEVVSVCDRNPRALKRAQKTYPAVQMTTDFAEVLESPQVDAVAIVTPVWTHFDLAKEALENGKHVFVEKPFTATSAQAARPMSTP